MSVVPAGFNTQALGAPPPSNISEAELLRLLKLLQSAQQGAGTCSGGAAQGAAAPTLGAGAPGLPTAPPQSVEARLAQVEADVRALQNRVQEHTQALAEIISRDPALLKKFQVAP
jgi:hypothetical protein